MKVQLLSRFKRWSVMAFAIVCCMQSLMAQDDYIEVAVTLTDFPEGSELPTNMYARRSDGTDLDNAWFSVDEDTGMSYMYLTEGVYDIFAQQFSLDDENGKLTFLIKEDVEVKKDMKLDFSYNIADKSVKFKSYTLPDGSLLEQFAPGMTVCTYSIFRGESQIMGRVTNYAFAEFCFPSNLKHTEFVRILTETTQNAMMVFPINDDSPSVFNVGKDNWQQYSISSVNTPLYEKALVDMADQGVTPPQYAQYVASINDKGIFSMSSGSINQDENDCFKTWIAEGYDGPVSLSHQFSVNTIVDKYNTISLPLTKTINNKTYLNGKNSAFGSNLSSWPASQFEPATVQERYMFEISPDMKVGNSAPILIMRPFPNDYLGFAYTWVGRYGEIRSIDSFNMSTIIPEELIEKWGQNHSVKMWFNGNEICSSVSDFEYFDWSPFEGEDGEMGEFKVELTDFNVRVDDIDGINKTTMEFSNTYRDMTPPTLTMLSFRGKDDSVTDRFQAEDGMLEFSAADFVGHYDDMFYYTTKEIQHPKVEYAPMGSSQFEDLKVDEIPELFAMPGWGYFYRGELSQLGDNCTDGWYDLRITLFDMIGNSQSQVISPAFKIESGSVGVESIETSNEEAVYYTLQGIRVNNPTKGIYLERRGDRTRKVRILK